MKIIAKPATPEQIKSARRKLELRHVNYLVRQGLYPKTADTAKAAEKIMEKRK